MKKKLPTVTKDEVFKYGEELRYKLLLAEIPLKDIDRHLFSP